jgi:hypothetical protein
VRFLGEGMTLLTGDTWAPASLNVNNLEAAVLHFAIPWPGLCLSRPTDNLRKNSWAASRLAYVQFSQASHNPLSTLGDPSKWLLSNMEAQYLQGVDYIQSAHA